jgi:hypothetical protein
MNDSITQQRKDFDALIKLQAAVAAFKEIEFFGQQEEDPNIREAKAALQTILEGLRKREADARSAPPVEPTSLGNSLNEAVSAVGLFNGKLLEISEIQEKFARGLSGPVATPGVINRASSTVGGIGGAEAISKIEELIRRTSSGGIGIGRSKEFQSLEKVIKETGGTAAQRSRLEELKRTEVSPRSFGAGQETDAARTLLRDREISGGLEQGFRGLLQGNTGLVEQLREARGTGARGARAIDPERVREILGRGGLSGLARDVDTKGEATQLVDKLLKFSDELSKTPDRLSERAVNILREILATELKEGFKEVAQVLQAQRNPISEEEKKAADARGTRVDIFNENSAVDFANKFNAALKEQFDERAQVFAEVLNGAIRASLQNNNIKVDIPSLDIELRTTVTNVLAGDAFLNALEEKLTGIFGRDEDFTKLRDKIKEIATVMVSTGQIQPE